MPGGTAEPPGALAGGSSARVQARPACLERTEESGAAAQSVAAMLASACSCRDKVRECTARSYLPMQRWRLSHGEWHLRKKPQGSLRRARASITLITR